MKAACQNLDNYKSWVMGTWGPVYCSLSLGIFSIIKSFLKVQVLKVNRPEFEFWFPSFTNCNLPKVSYLNPLSISFLKSKKGLRIVTDTVFP